MDPASVVGDWYPAAFDQEVTEIPHMRLEPGFEDFFVFFTADLPISCGI